jgi:F0F1-type ATP synthase assembly protein I
MGDGWAITSTFVAGIGLWGGLGFLADHWLGSRPALTVIGMMLGAAAATYIVWLRYGRGEHGGTGT